MPDLSFCPPGYERSLNRLLKRKKKKSLMYLIQSKIKTVSEGIAWFVLKSKHWFVIHINVIERKRIRSKQHTNHWGHDCFVVSCTVHELTASAIVQSSTCSNEKLEIDVSSHNKRGRVQVCVNVCGRDPDPTITSCRIRLSNSIKVNGIGVQRPFHPAQRNIHYTLQSPIILLPHVDIESLLIIFKCRKGRILHLLC